MAYNQPTKITKEMPLSHHADDAQWINAKLSSIPDSERGKVCIAYSNAFNAEHEKEPATHRKDGKARLAANTRLLKYVAKRFAVFNK